MMFVCRQQRKYRLFAGLWFGVSKPHFQTFMQPFATALNDLFFKGKVNIKLQFRNFLQNKNENQSKETWKFYKIITADCYIFS